MRLQPEVVILPDGTRYRLRAELTGTPGSRTHVGSEGAILPNSRIKRDSIEYGGAVGAGAVTGRVHGRTGWRIGRQPDRRRQSSRFICWSAIRRPRWNRERRCC